ncbi:MAG: rhodanese-like domain-containing protein [Proteobacteria bacterium]|nr:rhodanese-like domain-containing protein [Pseudomonadota bacterium]
MRQNNEWSLLFLLNILLIFNILSSCGNDDDDSGGDPDADADTDSDTDTGKLPDWPSGKYISIDEVHQRVQAKDPDMLLINVSDEEFYSLGHIEGSLKIPWDVLDENLDKVDSKKHIVIYCRRGVRSENAYNTFEENSYELFWVMEDGLETWISKGYPTEKD